MNQQWDGDANTKFHAAFNTDKTKMDKFHTAIQNYCNKLEEIVKKYETTEQKVANICYTKNLPLKRNQEQDDEEWTNTYMIY